MDTLKTLRINLGWTINKLAKEAGVPHHNVSRAEAGGAILPTTAKAIADALSRGYGREIKPSEIEGLNIQ